MGHDTEASTVVIIDDYELDVVFEFTYLGSTITDNLSLDTKIDGMIKTRVVCEDKMSLFYQHKKADLLYSDMALCR